MPDVHTTLTEVFREEVGRLTAALIHILGDFAVAEEIVQDALVVALERWPLDGVPEWPGAWLLTVARRRALNQLSRDARYRTKLAQLEQPIPQEPDDRVRLMFTCCHPALSRTGQIVTAHIPYRLPTEDDMGERLSEVMAVLYLMFNEGYLASSGTAPTRRDLAEDAAWLTALVAQHLSGEPEPLGLLALMRLHLARSRARFTSDGELILLRDQNRTLWDRSMITEGIALIEQAAALGRPGHYQVEAAIVACHAEAANWTATDWRQIVLLYHLLLQLKPSPVVRLNRAVALRQVEGPEVALEEVNALAGDLENYHLFHAIRGELLLESSKREQARASALRALELTQNSAEQFLLTRRLLEW